MATNSMSITKTVGKALKAALEAKPKAEPKKAAAAPKAEPKDTNLGPNAAFPFGIKIADDKGNISWERFKTAKDRDARFATVKGGKRVDLAIDTPAAAPAAKPAAAPAAAPKAEPKKAAAAPAAAKPAAAPKAEPKKAAAPDTFALHVNKTGRLCFGKDAAERILQTKAGFCSVKIEGKSIRLIPEKKEIEGAVILRFVDESQSRPYISATKAFKQLGFDGSRSYDCEAKPYGNGGFEFRLL